jgi:UDP-N-acetylglucosamine--N-acetylmuramyl-(pentapeptide) pyrophosphoryl-undecaprenol N-acetylglucosamine transferase
MARLLGIPLVIHEQNAIPGLANRLLAPLASRVLEAFPHSFPAQRGAIAVGNPVRREILQVAGPEQRFEVRTGHPRLLILGGSLGAQVLNERVASGVAASGLTIEVRHQAGRGKLQAAQAAYAAAGVEAEVSEFIEDMAAAYEWADLVICRAGALTVSELAAAGVASILVPYPHAVDDHQRHNALFLAKQHAAVLLLQDELNAPALGLLLQGLLAGVDRVREMALAAKRQGVPDAAQRVADICEEVMGR